MRKLTIVALSVAVLAAPALAQQDEAARRAKVVAPFVDAATLAVVRVSMDAKDIEAYVKLARRALAEPATQPAEADGAEQIGLMLARFAQAGATELYVVFCDPLRPRLTVASLAKDADPAKLPQLFGAELLTDDIKDRRPVYKVLDGTLVIASAEQLRQLLPADRPELAKAFAAGGDSAIEVAFIPPAQLMKELVPTSMPAELGGFDVQPLRSVRWAALDLAVKPANSLKINIQASDAASAKAVAETATKALDALVKSGEIPMPEGSAEKLSQLVKPVAEGDRVTVALDDKQVAALVDEIIGPAVRSARQLGRKAASAATIRMLLTGSALYAEEHNGQWPPDLQALVDMKLFSAAVLVNPSRPEMKPGYVYIRPLPAAPADRMVIYENFDKWDPLGISAGFADGHVELIKDEAQFRKLLATAKGN